MVFFNRTNKTLINKIHDLEARINTLTHDLIHDELTGLKTRRFLEEEARSLFQTHQEGDKRKEYPEQHAILFCDVDNFKRINDTFGHKAGDEALKRIAHCIMDAVRGGDICARWGGEEIVIILIDTTREVAERKGEEIRACIEGLQWPAYNHMKTTISIGVTAALPGHGLPDAIHTADEAMYKAKRAGKNRVVFQAMK